MDFKYLALIGFMLVSIASAADLFGPTDISPIYNGKVAALMENGMVPRTIVSLVNPTTKPAAQYFLSDCEMFTCTLKTNITFDVDTNITQSMFVGYVSDPKLAKFNALSIYDTRDVTYESPVYGTRTVNVVSNLTNITENVNESYIVKYETLTRKVTGWYSLDTKKPYEFKGGKTYTIGYEYSRGSLRYMVDLIPSVQGIKLEQWAWWDASWLKKKSINITMATNATNYPYQVNLTYDADMKTDFSDLRFTNGAETLSLPFNLETKSDSNWAVFSFKGNFTTVASAQAYAYYNNSAATDGSAANSTYDYYNTFDQYAEGLSLNGVDGITTLAGSTITNSSQAYSGKSLFQYSAAVDNYFKLTPPTITGGRNYYINFMFKRSGASTNVVYFFPMSVQSKQLSYLQYAATGTQFSYINSSSQNSPCGITFANNTWYNITINFTTGGYVSEYVDGVACEDNKAFWIAWGNSTDTLLYGRSGTNGYAGQYVYWDNVLYKQYQVGTSYTIGAEEENSAPQVNGVKVNVTNLGTTNNIMLQVDTSNSTKCDFLTFTNTSFTGQYCYLYLTAGNLSYNGTVHANDSAGNMYNFTVNFTITNNSYVMNSTTASTESAQYFVKSDTATANLGSGAVSYNLTFSTPTSATADWNSGAGTMNATVTGGWHGDWINASAQGTYGENYTAGGTQNSSYNSFNGSLSWAANTTMPATVNFTYAMPTADVGGTCTGDTFITGAGTHQNLTAGGTGTLQTQVYADCINAPAWSAWALNTTYGNTSQSINRTATWISLWSANLLGVVWGEVEGSACWTTATESTGNYTIATGGGTLLAANATGDCIVDGSFGAYATVAGYTNTSQTIQSNQTVNNSDTDFAFIISWSRANDASCFTDVTQLSGTRTLSAATNLIVANATGDCIDNGAFGAFALSGVPTLAAQTVQSNASLGTNDTNFTWTIPWAAAAEGTACWTSGTQQLSGSIDLSSNVTLEANQTGDCISSDTFGAFSVIAGATNASQTVQSSMAAQNDDTYAFTGIAWTKTAEGTACWTTGAQALSGTFNLAGGGTTTVLANQTGDCISEGAFGNFYLVAGYSNTSQTVQSNSNITSGDAAYTFPAIAWGRIAEGSTCWTSGVQALSGTYTLTGASYSILANQTGDCIVESAFAPWTLNGVPTEAAQSIQTNSSLNTSDTDFIFSVPWYAAPEGTACWTSGTQQLSGTQSLTANTTLTANQTGDCITDAGYSVWALNTTYGNTTQTINSTKTSTNGDTFTFNGVAWTRAAEGSACWTTGVQVLSGTYDLAAGGNAVVNASQSGDCIVEGICAFAVLGTPTETNQTIQCTQPINNSDTGFTFSVPWGGLEGSACWTTGLQQTSGTITLNAASINAVGNQTGQCLTVGAESGWAQEQSATKNSTVLLQFINNSRSITNLDTYTMTGLAHTYAAVPNVCFTNLNGSPVTYNLAGSATIGQDANASGDCITEVVAPVNTSMNFTQQPRIYLGNTTLYIFGNATATTVFDFQNISWSYTDSYIYFNSTNLRQNMTFNLTTVSPGLIEPYWYVNLTATETNITTATWAPYNHGHKISISDDPYTRTVSNVSFGYNFTTDRDVGFYKCTASPCDVANAGNWTVATFTTSGNEIRRIDDTLSNLTYLIIYLEEEPFNMSYDTWVYETNTTTLTAQLYGISNISQINGMWLNHSGTIYAGINNTGVFSANVTHPLEHVNNTNHSFYWIANIQYLNGTSANITNDATNQTVYQAYIPLSVDYPDDVLENNTYTANMTLFNPLNLSTLVGTFNLNGTNWNLPYYNNTLRSNGTVAPPSITVSSASLSTNGTLNITFGGLTENRTVAGSNSTVYLFTLTNCSNSSYAFNVTVRDEINNTLLNFSMEAVFRLYTADPTFHRDYTFTVSNVESQSYCVVPEGNATNISAVISYTATGYPTRGYAGTLYNLSSPISHYNLTLWAINGTYYVFTIINDNNEPIQSAYILANRSNITVQTLYTNPDGTGSLLLQPFFPYQITVSKDGHTPLTFNYTPANVYTMSIMLNRTNRTFGEYYQINGATTVNCTQVNVTGNISINCTITDTSGLLETYTLTVTRLGNATYPNYVVCTNTSTNTSGGNVLCNIGNSTGYYSWALTGFYDINALLASGLAQIGGYVTTTTDTYLFMAMAIIVGTATVGLWAPPVGIVLTIFATALMTAMNWLPFGWGGVVGLMGLGAIIIYKMR